MFGRRPNPGKNFKNFLNNAKARKQRRRVNLEMEPLEQRRLMSVDTWIGGSGGNHWSVGANWSGGVPQAGDNLVFPTSPSSYTSVNNISGTVSFGNVTIADAGYSISGSAIGLGGSIGASYTSGTSSFNIPFNYSSSSNFDVAAGGTLDLDGNVIDTNSSTFTKTGSGVLEMGAIVNADNPIEVAAGALFLNGSSNGEIDPDPGATVGGTGTIGGSGIQAGSGGAVSPGPIGGTGTLVVDQQLYLSSLSALAIGITGTGFGQVELQNNGNATITNSSLDVTLGSDYIPRLGQSYQIITNAQAGVTGQFSQGSSITVSGVVFGIDYNGDSGYVDLTVTAVPSFTWTGGSNTSSNWSDGANWFGGTAPTMGSDLIFPSAASRKTNTNDLPADMIFGDITVGSSGYAISGNRIDLGGTIGSSYTSGSSAFNNPVAILTHSVYDPTNDTTRNVGPTFNVAGGGMFQMGGSLSGSGAGIIKTGAGELDLSGNSTNDGTNDIQAGSVVISSNTALGSTAGATTVEHGGKLVLSGGLNLAQTLKLNSGTITGSLSTASGEANTISGQINFTADGSEDPNGLGVQPGNTLTLSGYLHDPSYDNSDTIHKALGGTLIVTGSSNDYTGGLLLDAGILQLKGAGVLGDVNLSTVVVASGAEIDLTGGANIANSITASGSGIGGTGGLFHNLSGTNTISGAVTLNTSNEIFNVDSGTTLVFNGVSVSGGSAVKTGAGTFDVVYAIDSPLTVTQGLVDLEYGPDDVILNGGTITGNTPGGWTGDLTATSIGGVIDGGNLIPFADITLNSAVTWNWSNGSELSNSDTLHTFTLGDATLNATIPVGASIGTVYTLTSFYSGSGTISGEFDNPAGTPLAEGSEFYAGNGWVTISYAGGGNNNEVTLTVSGPPPTMWTGAGTDNLWTDANNWTGNIAPVAGQGLIFPSNALQKTNVDNFADGFSFGGVTIGGSGYAISSQSNHKIDLSGDITATYTSGSSTFGVPLTLESNPTIAVATGGKLVLSGSIGDAGSGYGFVKTGAGELDLDGAGNYSGTNSIQGGTVVAAGTNILGNSSGQTFFESGTTLIVEDGANLGGPITFNGASIYGSATSVTGENNEISGFITLQSDTTISVQPGDTLTLSGEVTDSGGGYGITKLLGGTLILTNASNGYTGDNNVDAGIMEADGGTLGASNNVNIASGAELDIADGAAVSSTVNALGSGIGGTGGVIRGLSGGTTISGSVYLNSSSEIIDAEGTSSLTLSGGNIQSGRILKNGTGTLVLESPDIGSAYTVQAGIIDIEGPTQTSDPITLNGGEFEIGLTNHVYAPNIGGGLTATSIGGTLGPAFYGSQGNVTLNSAVTWNDYVTTSSIDLEYSSYTATLGDATLEVSNVSPTVGYVYPLVSVAGGSSITGNFDYPAGHRLNEGDTFFTGTAWVTISYVAYSGSAVALTVISTPTDTWSGGGTDALWTDGANWVGGVAPVAGEALLFPSSASQKTNTDNFAAGTTFYSIEIDGSGYDLQGTNAIDLSSGISNSIFANTIEIPLTLTANQTFNVSPGGGLTLSGAIGDGGNNYGFTKTGTGNLTLSGANTYGGLTTVSVGAVVADSNTALGSTVGGTNVASGASVEFEGGISSAESITITGTGVGTIGAIDGASGVNTLTGTVTIVNAAFIGVASGSSLTAAGVIAGTGGDSITKSGTGTLILTGTNTFDGKLMASIGTTVAESNGALGSTASGTIVASGGLLQIVGGGTGISLGDAVSISGTGNQQLGGRRKRLGHEHDYRRDHASGEFHGRRRCRQRPDPVQFDQRNGVRLDQQRRGHFGFEGKQPIDWRNDTHNGNAADRRHAEHDERQRERSGRSAGRDRNPRSNLRLERGHDPSRSRRRHRGTDSGTGLPAWVDHDVGYRRQQREFVRPDSRLRGQRVREPQRCLADREHELHAGDRGCVHDSR